MDQIQEITQCSVCTDVFTDPRILTCIHTFCLKCLEETATNRELHPGDTMSCPLCRKCFCIPNDGMVGLQKNLFMERLVEISKLLQPPSGVLLCDVCKTDKPTGKETNAVPTAVQFCIQCEQNICNRCSQEHRRFKELQRHELIPVGSSMKDTLMRKVSLQFCDQHNKKELEMYCVDCRQVICMKCFAQKHKYHNCLDIDEVTEDFREKIRCDQQKMKDYEAETLARNEEIVILKTNFQKQVKEKERAIIQRGSELKELVDRHTSSLLKELSEIKQRVLKEMATHQEEIETHKIIINSFEKYCTELNSRGSSAEICRAAGDLLLRAEELEKIHERQIHQQIYSTEVKFQASDVDDYLKKENIVGKIRVPFRSHGKLILPSDTCFVRGVTKLENKIYVLCQYPNLLCVFDDQDPYEFEKDAEISGIENPSDIESCEITKCLYLIDSDNCCIWKITVNDHRLTKLLTNEQISEPFTISVTAEGQLLVLRIVEQLRQLDIYGSDAKLVRRISLPDGIYWPEHAIQTPNGDFIIIHCKGIYEGSWVISRLTSDGQTVIARFDLNDETREIDDPLHLALDSENDRLFVADWLSGNVIAFDSLSLSLTEVFLTEEETGNSEPCRLCYDNRKKQLIVAQHEREVDIYEVY